MSQALSLSTTDSVVNRTVMILNRLFLAPRAFKIRLWNGTELSASSRPAFSLILNYPGVLRRMFTPPIELALGEAFIYGDFDIDGDIFSAFTLFDVIFNRSISAGEVVALTREILALPASGPVRPLGRGPSRLQGARHSRERDRAAIQYHYNVGNDFYALWLDRRLQYSCAYFATGQEDLHTAQERKLEHICRKLRLKPGERLLDIGCGWGGLALYAAEKYGVHVLGVTLSDRQVEYANAQIARSGLGDRVGIKLQDYRDLAAESFDKVVSVGMFEHVGRDHLPEYFSQAYRLLKPGGLFLNHGISYRPRIEHTTDPQIKHPAGLPNFLARKILGTGSFMQRYVFPDGELVPVSEANLIAEKSGFEVRDVESLREHYALTLRQWVNRLEERRGEAMQASDEVTYRTWRLYMAASAYGFKTGNINVNQSLLAKPDHGQSHVPLTRADLYLQKRS
jgi:cyclopropane-fatty-acyl-phospholipid synthase